MSLFSYVCLAQDAGLDALAAVISRQKQMGQDIGNELDEQNGKWKAQYVTALAEHSEVFLWITFNLRSGWFYFVTSLCYYTTYDVIGSKMSRFFKTGVKVENVELGTWKPTLTWSFFFF